MKKNKLFILIILSLGIRLFAQTGTMTGNDGKIYQTVKIGNQWWMAENLKETQYRDGSVIPIVTDNSIWSGLKGGALLTGAYCAYYNDIKKANTYGYLYNWYAVNDSRNIAPPGWHVPTDEEWITLREYLGGKNVAGGKMKETGTTHWESPNTGATNESGYSALPGGYRDPISVFDRMGYNAFFWSALERSGGDAWQWSMRHGNSNIYRIASSKQYGFSVRLVRD
jgi:uncharacterized protein (TIGR02145 family)